MDELSALGVGDEEGEELLQIGGTLHAQHLEDRVDLQQVLLLDRQRLEQFEHFLLHEEPGLIAEQPEHALHAIVVNRPARAHSTIRRRRRVRAATVAASRHEELLRRREPVQAELLLVDDLVCLQHLAHQPRHNLLVHLPHVAVTPCVGLLEMLELCLQVLKLLCYPLVVLC